MATWCAADRGMPSALLHERRRPSWAAASQFGTEYAPLRVRKPPPQYDAHPAPFCTEGALAETNLSLFGKPERSGRGDNRGNRLPADQCPRGSALLLEPRSCLGSDETVATTTPNSSRVRGLLVLPACSAFITRKSPRRPWPEEPETDIHNLGNHGRLRTLGYNRV